MRRHRIELALLAVVIALLAFAGPDAAKFAPFPILLFLLVHTFRLSSAEPAPDQPLDPIACIANRRLVKGLPEFQSADDYTIACAIARVNRRYQRRIVISMFALALLLMALLMSAQLFLDDPIGKLLGFTPGAWYHSPIRPILFTLMCLVAAAGVWGIIRVSRAQRRRYLRREAAANEPRSVCTRCRYDLAALREQGPVVTCPECGTPITMKDQPGLFVKRPVS